MSGLSLPGLLGLAGPYLHRSAVFLRTFKDFYPAEILGTIVGVVAIVFLKNWSVILFKVSFYLKCWVYMLLSKDAKGLSKSGGQK